MAALRPIKYPMINGVRHSMASIELEVVCDDTGQRWTTKGWNSLSFERTRERGEVRGPHPDPLGRTRGQNNYSSAWTLYLAELNYMTQVVLGGAGYGDRAFRMVVQYIENGLDIVKVELRGCHLDKQAVDNSQGTDGTMVEMDLNPVKIIWNNQDDVDDPLAA